MTTTMTRWVVPAVGVIVGLLMSLALLGRQASLAQAVIAFGIVAAYGIALRALQSRSDMASLLSGLPRDERWESINTRALSLAAQLLAVALVSAFLAVSFAGGDPMPYAWPGALFAAVYLGGLLWYRSRS